VSAPSPALRDAATVMVVRDGGEGMEVFLLRRNLKSDFVGGLFVFPGGAVDEADRHADLESVCRGRSDDEASVLLGIPSGGLAYWVAAVRECFEEAGILLAYREDGSIVSLAQDHVAERFRLHRKAVDSGERSLVEVCAVEHLDLAVDQIHYFSHWITPLGAPRRYDTRFFVAAAPPEQVPLHDERETIAHMWVRPADALARHERGELDLILPTIKNLEAISRFQSSADLLAAAAAVAQVPAVLPRVGRDRGGVFILLPGDPGYHEAVDEVALPRGFPLPGRAGGPRYE